ncbi:MAG: hypothetical protein HYV96_12350 [Opitutae bacterium]|nr:hypothetical protein [Opitutae bacterium]
MNLRHFFVPLALLVFAFVSACATADTPAPSRPLPPLTQHGGTWPTSHVQGIAVDLQGGYVYYSFTTLLAKYDFNGKLVGTLVGWAGHLGDLDFNPRDGRVYGSLEYKKDKAFYVAIIDVSRLDHVGIDAATSEIFRTVYLPEVANDYAADLNGDGRFDGDVANTLDHRYGCSGIDGVSFGPEFGHTDGPRYLTVAYGIYANTARTDDDHQVLLQYDIGDWDRCARPLTEASPHRSGPNEPHGKFFVRTGNTTYGVQNLAYDETQQRWFMGVYKGTKPSFPNYLLFAIDARTPPADADLVGVPAAGGHGFEKGKLLSLAADGLVDTATGIRGWNQKADVGLQPIGGGLFYLAVNSGTKGKQTGDITLHRWTGEPPAPLVPATAADIQRLRAR